MDRIASMHRSMPVHTCRRIEHACTSDGAILPIYELFGCRNGPPILFAHGCGFSAGSCLPFLSHLAERARVFAYDARGHGGAYWPDGPAAAVFSPARFADDLLTVVRVVAQRAGSRPHFVGHSLGAGTALWSLLRTYSNPFATVTLFEPNVFPSLASPARAEAEQKNRRLIHAARLRRAELTGPAELAQKFMRAFAGFSENGALIHAHATLYRVDDYRWRLCCPPAVEAAIFENHQDDRLWKLLPTIAQRVVLISADPLRPDREWVTSCMQSVASLLGHCEARVIPDSTHLLVMTLPRETAEIVLRQLIPTELPDAAIAGHRLLDRPSFLTSNGVPPALPSSH
jgi:pimeloyl-ACP methyl ester carboxylesterase